MVSELLELNRYLHDFASAMWVCGSLLLWWVWREARRGEAQALQRIAGKLWFLTVPSLAASLATGAVRAATFASHEHPGEVTASAVALLVAKHALFGLFVAWAVRAHWLSRSASPFARRRMTS
ncbi:MAG: hypothetical protein FJ291_26310 [Planctomycetes bacterium]|nr:hypothetical protein [Planctomycetota bacterium]